MLQIGPIRQIGARQERLSLMKELGASKGLELGLKVLGSTAFHPAYVSWKRSLKKTSALHGKLRVCADLGSF
jgi:hypothetical protein